MTNPALRHIQSDFKKQVHIRFGYKSGYLKLASQVLETDYMYLSHMVGGRCKPSKALLAKLAAIPLLPEAELQEVINQSKNANFITHFPQSLADQITTIQTERNFPTFEATLIAVIKGGLHFYETQVRASHPATDPLD